MKQKKPPHPNSLANLQKGKFKSSEEAKAAQEKGLAVRRAKRQAKIDREDYWHEIVTAYETGLLKTPQAVDVLRIMMGKAIADEYYAEDEPTKRQARDRMIDIASKLLPYEVPRMASVEMKAHGLEQATDAELRAIAEEMGVLIEWEDDEDDEL